MRAAVLHGPRDVRTDDIEMPSPGAGEALVRVAATGVCGSDIPRVLGSAAHFYPLVLGHEIAGEVAAVGTSADEHLIGRRVAVTPLLPCHDCADCQAGRFAQCGRYSFIGSRTNGGLAEYTVAPVRNLTVADDSVPFRSLALVEPATVALHGLRHIGYAGGGDAVVLGVGTIGLFVLQWLRILGARRIAVVDINPERLAAATALGADAAFDARDAEVAVKLLAWQGSSGFGHVLETAGHNATMSLAFQVAGVHAQVCFIGTSPRDLAFDHSTFELMNRKEFHLTGSWMSCSDPFPGTEWQDATACMADGRLRVIDSMIDGVRPLEQVMPAFLDLERAPVSGKMLFSPDPARLAADPALLAATR